MTSAVCGVSEAMVSAGIISGPSPGPAQDHISHPRHISQPGQCQDPASPASASQPPTLVCNVLDNN